MYKNPVELEQLPPSPEDYGTTNAEALDAELPYLIEIGEVPCDLEGEYDSPMRRVFREAQDELEAEELRDMLREEEEEPVQQEAPQQLKDHVYAYESERFRKQMEEIDAEIAAFEAEEERFHKHLKEMDAELGSVKDLELSVEAEDARMEQEERELENRMDSWITRSDCE